MTVHFNKLLAKFTQSCTWGKHHLHSRLCRWFADICQLRCNWPADGNHSPSGMCLRHSQMHRQIGLNWMPIRLNSSGSAHVRSWQWSILHRCALVVRRSTRLTRCVTLASPSAMNWPWTHCLLWSRPRQSGNLKNSRFDIADSLLLGLHVKLLFWCVLVWTDVLRFNVHVLSANPYRSIDFPNLLQNTQKSHHHYCRTTL